jgi:glutamate carboxypeptidase
VNRQMDSQNGDRAGLMAFLDARSEVMVQDLRAFVERETPSDEPALLADFAHFLCEYAIRIGAREAELVSAAHGGSDVRLTFGNPDMGKPILLLGHFDTVWAKGTLEEMPFYVANGIAHGPGVFDMKAGLLQGLWAVQALGETFDSVPPIVMYCNCDEEIGSPNSRASIEAEARESTAVFVLEPSFDGSLKTTRKGVARYTVEVVGRSAHAGLNPDDGISAITELCRLVDEMDRLSDTNRSAGTSVNVGVIRGGTRYNVVAGEAAVEVDVRAASVGDADRIHAGLTALTPSHPDARVHVTGGVLWPPMERTAKTALLVERAQAAARSLGFSLGEAVVGGASDGNHCAAVGAAVIDGLGAVGGGAHAATEHVVVSELPRRAALVAHLLADYGIISTQLASLTSANA